VLQRKVPAWVLGGGLWQVQGRALTAFDMYGLCVSLAPAPLHVVVRTGNNLEKQSTKHFGQQPVNQAQLSALEFNKSLWS
jgi:hypothetical protein